MTIRKMGFVGVTTKKSAIRRIFPAWSDYLGLGETELVGYDLPVHAPHCDYRSLVDEMRSDPSHLGALVTTHKLDLFDACKESFSEIDDWAALCCEVSSISKRLSDSDLVAHAKDPVTAGQSLDHILPPNYWDQNDAEVLCFGAGGSGLAISVHLLSQSDARNRPQRITVVNRSPGRLDHMRTIHETIGTANTDLVYIANADPSRNDELMGCLPNGSLVINATGLGKDAPGSPITDKGVFPTDGISWELNYRGELDFLHQSNQSASSHPVVHDGWRYFIYGWTAVISEVFHRPITEAEVDELSIIAERLR